MGSSDPGESIRTGLRLPRRVGSMSDDRFQKDSPVYRKPVPSSPEPSKPEKEWVELEDWLFNEFDSGRIKTPETEILARIFGRDKLNAIYRRWKEGKEVSFVTRMIRKSQI